MVDYDNPDELQKALELLRSNPPLSGAARSSRQSSLEDLFAQQQAINDLIDKNNQARISGSAIAETNPSPIELGGKTAQESGRVFEQAGTLPGERAAQLQESLFPKSGKSASESASTFQETGPTPGEEAAELKQGLKSESLEEIKKAPVRP
jgi:hypothetical protein